ncbi:SGNH/GDSL hydrolase family protein [bacterium]|nr:SGNH/GDSL hydrolase family protein [bacterium]
MKSGPSRPSRGARALLALGTFFACFALVEVAWRVYLFQFAPPDRLYKWARLTDIPKEQQLYTPHPYLPYALSPGYRSTDGRNRVNALGFRGDEITREKPPGVYRIACLGGSTTYTAVDDYKLTYPHLLGRFLRERHGHPEVEVINAGVSGYTSWENLVNFQFRVLDLDPDLIVLYLAVNDAKARLVEPSAYLSDNSGYRRPLDLQYSVWEKSLFIHYLFVQWGWSETNSLERRARRPGFEVEGLPVRRRDRTPEEETEAQHRLLQVVEENPPVFFERNLRNLVALARENHVAVLLTSWTYLTELGGDMAEPYYQKMVAEHNAVSRRLAEEMGTFYYDFAAEMPKESRLFKDCMHVNEEGSPVMADLFARFIAREILPASG